MKSKADVLVIFAHPDDAEFGAAGTVANWTREGKAVVYAACTRGDKGTSDRDMSPERLAEIREGEQRDAAQVLGVREVLFLGYSDQCLEDTPDFRKQIVGLLRTHRPGIVVTSDPNALYRDHRDHRVVGRATLDAVYPCARDHLAFPDLLEEGLEPHNVREVWFWGSDHENHFIDITGTFALKVAAMNRHESQMQAFTEHEMEAWLRAVAEEKARGRPYLLAEAFHREILPP
jgi:LmbE family N-acetylglucosaminyl deacetylase